VWVFVATERKNSAKALSIYAQKLGSSKRERGKRETRESQAQGGGFLVLGVIEWAKDTEGAKKKVKGGITKGGG